MRRRRRRERKPIPGDLFARAPQALAWRVRAMRRYAGLSQEELAARSGTSQGAISRIESGGCPEMTVRIVVGVFVALVLELLPMRDAVSEEVRVVLDLVTGTFPFLVENREFAVFRDPGLAALVLGYQQLAAPEQRRLLRVVTPLFEDGQVDGPNGAWKEGGHEAAADAGGARAGGRGGL